MQLAAQQNRKKLTITIAFSLLFLFLFCVPVFADMRKSIMNVISAMLDEIFGQSWTTDVMDIVVISDEKYGTVINALSTVYAQIEPIGYAVTGLYFVIALIEMAVSFDEMTWEKMLQPMVRTVVCIIIIRHGMQFFVQLVNLGSGFLDTLKGSMSSSGIDDSVKNLSKMISEDSKTAGVAWATAFLFMIRLAFPWFISWILRAGIIVVAYSIVFEIFIRVLFAPVAVGDIAAHGIDGPGFRYLKALVAAGLRSALMMAVIYMGGLVSSGLFSEEIKPGTSLSFIVRMVVVQLVTFTLARGTDKLAKEVMGV